MHKNLVSALSTVSTQFGRLVSEVANRAFERQNSLESALPPYPLFPWLAKPRPHEHDSFRAEETLKMNHELEVLSGNNTGIDWNEELQLFREMPRSTLDERIARDTQLYRFHTDFVDTLSRGAQFVTRQRFFLKSVSLVFLPVSNWDDMMTISSENRLEFLSTMTLTSSPEHPTHFLSALSLYFHSVSS